MSVVVRNWLPDGALENSGVDRALADIVQRWSAKWFARRAMRPLAKFEKRQARDISERNWRTLGDGLALAQSASAGETLVALMLDLPDGTAPITDADRKIFTALSRRCLDDLGASLAEMFGLQPQSASTSLDTEDAPRFGAARNCHIGIGERGKLITLVVSEELLVRAAKAELPKPPAGPLATLGMGLARQPVAIGGALGTCKLTLADLAGLAIGDVVVLDGMVGKTVDLVIDRANKIGTGAVEEADGRLRLKVSNSKSMVA